MTPDYLITVQPEIDALTAALKENGIDLPAHARTSVRVHDLATVVGAVHILAGVVTEAETHTCPVCKGTRVAYETGLFWSEAHPCEACATVAAEPMVRGWKEAGVSWQQVATDLIAMLDLRASAAQQPTGLSAKSLQKLDADIEEAKAVLSEMAETVQPFIWPEPSPEALKHLDGLCDRIWQNEGGATGKELYANVVNILQACQRADGEPWNIVPYDKWHASQAICEANYMLLQEDHATMIKSRDYYLRLAGELLASRDQPAPTTPTKTEAMDALAKIDRRIRFNGYDFNPHSDCAEWFRTVEAALNEPTQKAHKMSGEVPSVMVGEEITAARLGCTLDTARQIVTGKLEAGQ